MHSLGKSKTNSNYIVLKLATFIIQFNTIERPVKTI